MKFRIYLLAIFLTVNVIGSASAGPLLDWLCGPQKHHADPNCCPRLPCCPDDYCWKPLPCLTCVPRCTGPDDYCYKPLPCLTCVPRCTGPDDYCYKPLPCLHCQAWSPYLTCGATGGCPGGACGKSADVHIPGPK